MAKFRKKPVVIEAIQWTGENYQEVARFVTDDPYHELGRRSNDLLIHTLEDGPGGAAQHYASVGDYIIKGVKGEFYPCKPDIFEQTYEPAHSGVAAASESGSASIFWEGEEEEAQLEFEARVTEGGVEIRHTGELIAVIPHEAWNPLNNLVRDMRGDST